MKSLLSCSFAFIIYICLFIISVSPDLSALTIAHWNFEDGVAGTPMNNTGSNGAVGTIDLSGNGYDVHAWDAVYGPSFSLLGDTSIGVGLSSSYNGSQDAYTTDAVINGWSPTIWTIEVAVKLDDLSDWRTLIGRDGSTDGPESDFYLQNSAIDDRFRITFATVDGSRYILDADFITVANQWYCLAVVSDGTAITMYSDKLDGLGYQSVGSLTMTGATTADNALAASGDNWTFGRGWYNDNFCDYITGNLDDIRFSDSALTPDQFLGHNPVIIVESDGKTLLYSDNVDFTDSYEIGLSEKPLSDVTVTVTPSDGLMVGNGSGQNRVLTFTLQNWDQPQAVTVQIADAGVELNSVENIHHTIESQDSQYNQISVRDILVYVEEDGCGIWGYLEADYNFNCVVDLEDFARIGSLWLATDEAINIQQIGNDWMDETIIYDEDIFNRSIQKSVQPFFVNTANIVNTVDEKVYGHFLEHIYHSANGGLWGDLIWNRSFENSYGDGSGIWSIEGNDLVQSSFSTDVHLEFGDAAWGDYEMTLQGLKDGGSEAFLILLRAPDSDNFYWCNIGGWGNSQHAIEKEVNGSRSVVGSTVSGSINPGQWYDIRVRCESNRIRVWLDESSNPDPIIDFTDTDSPYLTGMVGLGTWSTQSRFRNIQVTDIAGSTVLYSGLPSVPPAQFASDFWDAFGSGNFTQDTDALNDDYSVKVVASSGSTGIQQGNFKFTPQVYKGSLWMKGSLAAGLSVELLDGTTVLAQAILPAPTSSWAEYPFQITTTEATNDGSFRITLLGAGTVNVDQISMMGQDAIDTGGYRPDLLEAINGLRPPIIRWPGGCYVSAYFWKDGIGPQHEHHKYPISLWDDQDNNSYGTDEFLRMCEATGAEPLIAVNIGLLNGTCGAAIPYKLTDEQYLQDVEDWIEYCNGSIETQWGAVRAANGHPEPYNVKYWEIDNEVWSTSWGGGIAKYIEKVHEYAPVMKAKAESLGTPIKLIACGSGSYNQGWNRTLIDDCGHLFDYISTHHYEGPDNFKQGPRSYEEFIEELGGIIAASSNPDMKIYMSEWNAQSTDWRTGLYAGGLLNAFERTGDVFEIGGPALFLRHTSASGWDNAFINFDHTGWFPAPNYVVMKLWYDHFAPNRIETTGADTNLNVVTVMSEDEQTVNIRVVNPDAESKSVEFEIDSSFVPETAYMHYISPGDLYARNTLSDPSAVRVQAKVVGFDGQILRLIMPGYSAGVITVETSRPHATKLLYSSFRSNGQDGLHLAYSDDGFTWTALKGDNSFLIPQIGGNLMRDPSICQGADGMFHMVWTTGWWDKGIGVAHSEDLINWSSQSFLPVMAHEPDAKNCWAPEIFYDDVSDQFLVFWSTTIPGRFPETVNPDDDNNHRVYYVSTRDFVTYTDTALFYDPGFNVIDAFIAKDADQYVMYVKHESKNPVVEKNIRLAYSDSVTGPYSPASDPISPSWVEGPSAVKIASKWYLYYDGYTRGRMEGRTSSDLNSWADITSELNFPSGTRHGTVFKVTKDVLRELQNAN